MRLPWSASRESQHKYLVTNIFHNTHRSVNCFHCYHFYSYYLQLTFYQDAGRIRKLVNFPSEVHLQWQIFLERNHNVWWMSVRYEEHWRPGTGFLCAVYSRQLHVRSDQVWSGFMWAKRWATTFTQCLIQENLGCVWASLHSSGPYWHIHTSF